MAVGEGSFGWGSAPWPLSAASAVCGCTGGAGSLGEHRGGGICFSGGVALVPQHAALLPKHLWLDLAMEVNITCSRFKRMAVCVSLELFRYVRHMLVEEPGFHLRNAVVRGAVGLRAGSQQVGVKRPTSCGRLRCWNWPSREEWLHQPAHGTASAMYWGCGLVGQGRGRPMCGLEPSHPHTVPDPSLAVRPCTLFIPGLEKH